MKQHPELLEVDPIKREEIDPVANSGANKKEFSTGFNKLPVKNYGGNPVDLAEFLMKYKQMADSYGYSEEKAIQRLPIYLRVCLVSLSIWKTKVLGPKSLRA